MARQLTAEDVLELIEIDEQDLDEGDEIFFDGSDEEFGLTEEEVRDDEFVLGDEIEEGGMDEIEGGGMDKEGYDDVDENYGHCDESVHETDDERDNRINKGNKPK